MNECYGLNESVQFIIQTRQHVFDYCRRMEIAVAGVIGFRSSRARDCHVTLLLLYFGSLGSINARRPAIIVINWFLFALRSDGTTTIWSPNARRAWTSASWRHTVIYWNLTDFQSIVVERLHSILMNEREFDWMKHNSQLLNVSNSFPWISERNANNQFYLQTNRSFTLSLSTNTNCYHSLVDLRWTLSLLLYLCSFNSTLSNTPRTPDPTTNRL